MSDSATPFGYDDGFNQQLKAVEGRARKLLLFLDEDHNFDLPADFPEERVRDIAGAMARISGSLPEKLEISLTHAERRLRNIRRTHVPFNPDLGYGRNSYFDDLIAALISELSTALDLFSGDQDLPEKQVAENDVPLSDDGRKDADDIVAESQSLSDQFDVTLDVARDLLGSLEYEEAQKLLQSLSSTDILNRLSRSELRNDPKQSWLQTLSDEMNSMPAIMQSSGDALVAVADVGEAVWTFCKDPVQGVINGTRNLGKKLQQKSDELAQDDSSPGQSNSIDGGETPPFDLEKIKEDLINGVAPHPSHVPQIPELDFEDEDRLTNLDALSGLTSLRSLNLWNTQVSDVLALSGLTNLQSLIVSETPVSDVSSLSGLTNLQSLNLEGTQVSDVSSLSGLTNLQSLDLWGTQVSDVSSLSGLTSLQSLDLWGTQVSDVSSLSGLTSLQSLDLSGSQVSDVSALSGLTSLHALFLDQLTLDDSAQLSSLLSIEKLSLTDVNISDLSILTKLPKLKKLWFRKGQFSPAEVEKVLPGVEVEWDD